MKKLLAVTCTAAAVAAPAFASSSADQRAAHNQAVKTCQQLHKTLTRAEFKALYGKNGVAHCVKKETQENTQEQQQAQQQAQQNASQKCRQEQQADPQAFQTKYGTGNGKNAFGKCVSQTAKQQEQQLTAQDNQEDQNQVSAAKQCKKEQQADPQAFATKYGKNGNKRNAFGKCVSQTARQLNQQQQQGGGSQS